MIKKILHSIFSKMRVKKTIFFESVPDFSDNTKAVYDELVKRGFGKRYKMVWLTSAKPAEQGKNRKIKYINFQTKIGKLRYFYTLHTAKCLISCNRFLTTNREGQHSFYLTHGTPIKSVRGYYTIPSEVDYCISSAEGVSGIYSHEFNYPLNRIVHLGFPRNDMLYSKVDTKALLDTKCEKVIVWYPTFRQMKKGLKTASMHALPVIHNPESAKSLNEVARNNNTIIVLKPHFAQNLSYIKDLGLSNIKFIDDLFFENNNISSYEFVGSCDALITDYSSVYYDFTLCDKPVAAIWEDIEEYKEKPGLIDNYEYYMRGAEKIYTASELEKFVSDVAKGVDNLRAERNEIKSLVNYSDDAKNSERVVDFIVEKAGL